MWGTQGVCVGLRGTPSRWDFSGFLAGSKKSLNSGYIEIALKILRVSSNSQNNQKSRYHEIKNAKDPKIMTILRTFIFEIFHGFFLWDLTLSILITKDIILTLYPALAII